MSIKATRRGLFTLAAAVFGAGTLVAAKPAEAPAPWPLSHGRQIELWAKSALAQRKLDHRLARVEVREAQGGLVRIELWLETPYGPLAVQSCTTVERLEGGVPAHQRIAHDLVAHAAAAIKQKEEVA